MSISINDVARAAGVSKSTVSRALAGGSVSEEVRARVAAAVQATGYRPNLMARRLRARDAGPMGVLVADIRNPFFTALIRAVEAEAYRQGRRLLLCNTDEDPQREAMYLQLMQEERIAGLIFAPTQASLHKLERMQLEFPVVLVDRAGAPAFHDSVVLDNAQACATLVRHLVDQGRRRIAGVFGSTSSTARERCDGYLAAMRDAGLEPDLRQLPPTSDAAEAEVAQWLRQPQRPDAFVASNSLLLEGCLRAIRAAGLRIPGDVALAGFDNERWTELVAPAITVIEQPVEAMGRAAFGLLMERLHTPDLPLRKVIMQGRCIVRESTQAAG